MKVIIKGVVDIGVFAVCALVLLLYTYLTSSNVVNDETVTNNGNYDDQRYENALNGLI